MKKTLFFLVLAIYLVSWWKHNQLPDKPVVFPELLQDPIQTRVDLPAFVTHVGNEPYQVSPLYSYELWGMVVSYHHSMSWKDRIHKDTKDFINLKDLCVIWGGVNTSPEIYNQFDFSSGQWTCYYQTGSSIAYQRFDPTRLSNNHILVDDPKISEAVLKADYGDIIHMKGYLASYQGRVAGLRGTSTTRTDTGNGACETIYLTDFSILHRANAGWKKLYHWTGILLIILTLYIAAPGIAAIGKDLLQS
ncbi:hypothetical protein [Endozoicomonas sp. Mp262]|uniref:hypothetical protein n=1 Tax=Endozoicomonas sp. Mp262 TaxID=2919499 RepID=UPI0021D8E6C3